MTISIVEYTLDDPINTLCFLSDDTLCDIIADLRESIPLDDTARNWPLWSEFHALCDENERRAILRGEHENL